MDSGSFVSRTWIPDFLELYSGFQIQIPVHGANTHFRSTLQTDASTTSFPKRGRRLGNLVLSLNFSYVLSSVHYV